MKNIFFSSQTSSLKISPKTSNQQRNPSTKYTKELTTILIEIFSKGRHQFMAFHLTACLLRLFHLRKRQLSWADETLLGTNNGTSN